MTAPAGDDGARAIKEKGRADVRRPMDCAVGSASPAGGAA